MADDFIFSKSLSFFFKIAIFQPYTENFLPDHDSRHPEPTDFYGLWETRSKTNPRQAAWCEEECVPHAGEEVVEEDDDEDGLREVRHRVVEVRVEVVPHFVDDELQLREAQ